MTRNTKLWLVVAVLFVLANAGGAVVAAARGELLHACGHVALAVAGLVAAALLARRRTATVVTRDDGLTDQLTHLEQSLDAVAIEVERMGEGQRYMTNILAQRGGASGSAGEKSAPPARSAAQGERDARGSDE